MPPMELRPRTAINRFRKTMACGDLPKALFLLAALVVLRATAVAADNQISAAEQKEGWIQLFDGKTLNRWMTSDWQLSKGPVEDGTINPHNAGAYMMVYE